MAKSGKTSFVVSNDKNPSVKLKPGQKFKVTAVKLVDSRLNAIKKIGSRLCGGTSTCLALVDIGDDVINPNPMK
ncbi:MAG TPA: hypothetical protein VF487_08195 [Chitinophagaceae bacterium]